MTTSLFVDKVVGQGPLPHLRNALKRKTMQLHWPLQNTRFLCRPLQFLE